MSSAQGHPPSPPPLLTGNILLGHLLLTILQVIAKVELNGVQQLQINFQVVGAHLAQRGSAFGAGSARTYVVNSSWRAVEQRYHDGTGALLSYSSNRRMQTRQNTWSHGALTGSYMVSKQMQQVIMLSTESVRSSLRT